MYLLSEEERFISKLTFAPKKKHASIFIQKSDEPNCA